MKIAVRPLLLSSALVVAFTTVALAQGGATSSISGVIVDSAGGVIPGANIVATSASGTKFEAVTNASGAYSVPALSAGVYTVTVSLAGFKTRIVNDVRVQLGVPTTLNASLDVGDLTETITV